MNVVAEPFSIQKRGCAPNEYEDAACPTERTEYDVNDIHFAIADGATESLFARRWAEQLVFAVADGVLSLHCLSEGLPKLRTEWAAWLAGQSFPWYAEEKSRQGTFAALVALEVTSDVGRDEQEGRWYAAAVGDSCLFQVRGEEVIIRFPLLRAESFDSRPSLVGTVSAEEVRLDEKYATGTWTRGDLFYLMSDALACWFLKHIDGGGRPSDIHGGVPLTDEGQFCSWIETLRDQAVIRNDDCTLMRVSIR
jgi:hypothetical protein